MPWARLDDDFHDNGKILSLSHQAFRLYVCAITYSRRHRTAGALSTAQVEALCRQQSVKRSAVTELVDKDAWHWDSSGYRIHDFADYQPPADETNAERQRRYRAKRRDVTPAELHENDVTSVTSNGTITRYCNDPVPMPIVERPPTSSPQEKDTAWHDTHMAISRSPRVGAKPTKASKDRYDPRFEAWWSTYPRHDGKYAASLEYRDRLKAGRLPHQLDDAAQHFAGHHEAAGTPTEKIPHGSTWLHQHRDEEWETGPPDADRVVTSQATGPPSKLAQTAAGLRRLKAASEMNGDKRTSFFDLAVAGVGLPDPGGAGPDPRALPRPPGGPPLA